MCALCASLTGMFHLVWGSSGAQLVSSSPESAAGLRARAKFRQASASTPKPFVFAIFDAEGVAVAGVDPRCDGQRQAEGTPRWSWRRSRTMCPSGRRCGLCRRSSRSLDSNSRHVGFPSLRRARGDRPGLRDAEVRSRGTWLCHASRPVSLPWPWRSILGCRAPFLPASFASLVGRCASASPLRGPVSVCRPSLSAVDRPPASPRAKVALCHY